MSSCIGEGDEMLEVPTGRSQETGATWAKTLLRDETVKCLLWALVFASAILVISTGVAGLYLFLATHSHISMFIGVLYKRIDVGVITVVYCVLTFLLLGVGWVFTRRVQADRWRILTRTGLVAALLAPGIFPDTQLQTWLVLPALAHTLRCVFLRGGLWCALSFWPIPMIWFMSLLASLVCKCWQLKSKEKGL